MWSQNELTAHLNGIADAEVVMTFAQIDAVVGALPASARKHNAWWANSERSQVHSRAWLDAGFLATPQFVEGRVRFRRGVPSAPGSRTSRRFTTTLPAPPDLEPTGEAYHGVVAYDWLDAGVMTLSRSQLEIPTLGIGPGVYRFTLVEPQGDIRSYYVGESENLFKRMIGYRNPGSSQATNLRINPQLRGVLEEGGIVRITVVLEATLDGVPLDMACKPARLVVENTELLNLAKMGAVVENLRTGP